MASGGMGAAPPFWRFPTDVFYPLDQEKIPPLIMLQTCRLVVDPRKPFCYGRKGKRHIQCFIMKPFGEVLMDARNHKARWIRILAILLILLLFPLYSSACQTAPTSNRVPNLKDLQTFCDEQDITYITDQLMDDSSVLLYEKDDTFGYYTLTVQEPKDKLVVLNHKSSTKSDQPILILDKLSEEQPIMAVFVQDTKLLAETTAIEVGIDPNNRLTATIQDQKGVILISPTPVETWRTITLYNAQGGILYSQEGQ
jgi:hypothetical protein